MKTFLMMFLLLGSLSAESSILKPTKFPKNETEIGEQEGALPCDKLGDKLAATGYRLNPQATGDREARFEFKNKSSQNHNGISAKH